MKLNQLMLCLLAGGKREEKSDEGGGKGNSKSFSVGVFWCLLGGGWGWLGLKEKKIIYILPLFDLLKTKRKIYIFTLCP